MYPTLFNYRQYIELSLKGIVRDARRLLEEPGEAPTGHEGLSAFFGAVETEIDVRLNYKSDALAAEYEARMEMEAEFLEAYGYELAG